MCVWGGTRLSGLLSVGCSARPPYPPVPCHRKCAAPAAPRTDLHCTARPYRRYAAIFKHAKDELGFCYYLIPCGAARAKGQMGSVTVSGAWGGAGVGSGRGGMVQQSTAALAGKLARTVASGS